MSTVDSIYEFRGSNFNDFTESLEKNTVYIAGKFHVQISRFLRAEQSNSHTPVFYVFAQAKLVGGLASRPGRSFTDRTPGQVPILSTTRLIGPGIFWTNN